jgi:hypothetical protein
MHCNNKYSTFRLIQFVLFSSLLLLITAGGSPARPVSDKEGPELQEGLFNFIHNDGRIIINDCIFTVDRNTRYVTKQGQSITLDSFGEGDKVLFSASEDRILMELQLQEKSNLSQKQSAERRESVQQQEVHLENGVWKN